MHKSDIADPQNVLFGKIIIRCHLTCDHPGIQAHTLRMSTGIFILGIDSSRDGFDGVHK